VNTSPRNFPYPTFTNPPVVEVICGVTFKPLGGLLAPHLGLLWTQFRDSYPDCKQVDPLIPVIETFDGDEQRASLIADSYFPRVWFFSKDENSILQIQRDRLLHNWRKVRPTDAYPRYANVSATFWKHLGEFQRFLADNGLGSVVPEQLEMTYLNHIPHGQGWTNLSELGRIFPDFAWRDGNRFLPVGERATWRTSFPMPDHSGRLHVLIQTAFRRNDRLPIVVVDITARGLPKDLSENGLRSWYDLAHEWIVKSFADLTSENAHALWSRKE
jgi:uncharacterized protein (TIGR04255 family)